MSRWWRAYDEAVDDPKLCLLDDKQHRAWFNLCCITSQNGGRLPPIASIAFKLRMTPAKAKTIVAELVALGLVDMDDQGLSAPHNWNARQYKSDVADPTAPLRQKAYRDRIKNRNATVTTTVTRAETEQITETDQRKKTRASALAAPWVEADRERFWEVFPNKVGKADAMKALDKASHKTTPEVLFTALNRYANKTDDRPFCNPATWLNQERWLDEPAANNGHGTSSNRTATAAGSAQTGADSILAGMGRLAARNAERKLAERPGEREGEPSFDLAGESVPQRN